MVVKKRQTGALIVLAVLAAVLLNILFIRTDGFGSNDAEELNPAGSTTVTQKDRFNPADRASNTSQDQSEQDEGNENGNSSASQEKTPDGESADQRAESAVSDGQPEDSGLKYESTISGTVLDNTGQLVQGATVIAEAGKDPGQGENGAESPVSQLSKVTDHLGGFEFNDLEEGEYELTASKGEEYFPARTKVRTGMANAELTMQRLRPVRVFGTVSDEQGVPLDAVTVRILGTRFKVQSDENGGYEIMAAPMRAGTPPVLKFSRDGYQETLRPVKAALNTDREEVQFNVQLDADSNHPKVAVAGQILGPIGEAVVGVNIRLKSFKMNKGYSARTDKKGEFNIPTVEVGEGYQLNVMPSEDYEAYQSERFALGPQDAFFEIELDAAKFASLSGTVTDLYGKPLPGFQLGLRGIGMSAQSQFPVRTDDAGQFRVEQLRAGEVALETYSSPLLRVSGIVLDPGEHREVDVPLDWGTDWLFGRVVDAEGNPVSGASIIIIWKEQFRSLVGESRRELRSDLEGYFTASNLGAEQYTLIVQAPGYQTFRGTHQLSGGAEELVVQLQ